MFEHKGYFKEYIIDGKSIGTISCEKDREVIGYSGKKTEIVLDQIILDNGKKIKQGSKAITIVYPLSGRLINKNQL
jgi:hypothetical protein